MFISLSWLQVNTVLLFLIMRTFISLKANTKKSETDRLK